METDKELHQKFLADIRCDVSQHRDWRIRLFDHAVNTKFEITPESIADNYKKLSENIAKYNLKYIVEKVRSEEGSEATKDVVFKFYPKNYPELVKYSFNNPGVL
jgi:hypothetical protein